MIRAALVTVSLISLLAGGLWLSQSSAGAQKAPSRVIDRTLSCTVGLTGGLHKIEVSTNTGTRLFGNPSTWKYLAGAGVRDTSVESLAGVSAGNPPPGGLYVAAGGRCKPGRRVRMSSAGLMRTPVSALPANPGEGVDCFPGRHAVVRVRGIFSAPTSLHVKRYAGGVTQLAASGTVKVGYLAVRSSIGKPLAYAEVFENGKARLFTARSCF